jgi:hypothetical protein
MAEAKLFRRGALLLFNLVVAGLVLGVADAHAYVDPGSGSLFFQLLIAGLMAAAYTARLYWQKIKTFVRRFSQKRGNHPEDVP